MFSFIRTDFLLVILIYFFVLKVNANEIDISGYATVFAGYTNEKDNSYSDFSADNFIDFTDKSHVGLQFNTNLYKNIDFSMTVLMEGTEEFAAHTDWFYLTFITSQNTLIHYGRLKVPFLMTSDYIDIGHAYPWVTPPEEVYSVNLAKSADGIEFIYDAEIFGSNLMLDLYAGTGRNNQRLSASFINDTSGVNTGLLYIAGDKIKYKMHDLLGFETSLANNIFTFRIGQYQMKMDAQKFNIDMSIVKIKSAGIIIDWENILLYSEYIKREADDSVQHLFPDQDSSYVTISYKISDFLPYITFAKIDKGTNKNKYGLIQSSTSLGLRYDIKPRMDIKFQITKVKPGMEPGDIGRFGFFDSEIEQNREPMVYTTSLDILF